MVNQTTELYYSAFIFRGYVTHDWHCPVGQYNLWMFVIHFRLAVKEMSHQRSVAKLGLNHWRLTVLLFS